MIARRRKQVSYISAISARATALEWASGFGWRCLGGRVGFQVSQGISVQNEYCREKVFPPVLKTERRKKN